MAFKTAPPADIVPTGPEGILLTLPRRKITGVLIHQGEIMRSYATQAQSSPDVALQLPTGSGKTLVGLMIAEWRRRKFNERVVYLCPTKQLVNQVVEQASDQYGLTVTGFTGQKRDYTASAKADYLGGGRVAVTTYSGLFNSNPFFSNPHLIILDDAHAAENYVASYWTITVSRLKQPHAALHSALVGVLTRCMESYDVTRMTGRWDDENRWVDKLSTPALVEVADELIEILDAHTAEIDDLKFRWPTLRSRLKACHIYMSGTEITIRPIIPPTMSFEPFQSAKQRIYMSATLGAGGDLERMTGRKSIQRIPVPEGWDQQGIGRRFFIFPTLSEDAENDDDLPYDLMREAKRSLVLVPSDKEGSKVVASVDELLGFKTFGASDIELSKRNFVSTAEAVGVVANRYDGIDFPNDDCRLLYIKGLPSAVNLQERFIVTRMGGEHLFQDRIQTRVLQAIGRCTRSLRDYSAVIVDGAELVDFLTDAGKRAHLHPELQAELWFGIAQSAHTASADILENLRIFLENGEAWGAANNQILSHRGNAVQAHPTVMSTLEAAVRHEVEYQYRMWNGDYENALAAAESVLGVLTPSDLRGYRALWHYLAGSAAWLAADGGSTGLVGQAKSHFALARGAASDLPWLSALTRYDGSNAAEQAHNDALMRQIERVEQKLKSLGTVSDRGFAKLEKQIMEGLEDPKRFEHAQVLLGELLGFEAGNEETDAAPDPWWIADGYCIVFEDYVENKGGPLGAEKSRQAAGHPNWIRASGKVPPETKIVSVLVSPVTTAKVGAAPHLATVGYWPLSEFRQWALQALSAVRSLRATVSKGPLVWRAEAAHVFMTHDIEAGALFRRLQARTCDKALTIVA